MQKINTRTMEEKYIAAIDLGTYKTALSVAKISGDDMQIVYYRETPSDGIRNSSVFNPMKASGPVRKAVREAEDELKIKILQAAVGLPRNNVLQKNATAEATRSNQQEYISKEEVRILQDMALDSYEDFDDTKQELYGAVTQSFSTDDEINMVEDDVVGTISSHIAGNFRIFIGQRSASKSIDKVFNDLGISIIKKYFLPDVVAHTVLTEDEIENGTALIDFGAGVTSVSIYSGGIMRFYASVPFGGKDITCDIQKECCISEKLAENIKLAYGACMPERLASLADKILQIQYSNGPYKEIKVEYISKIIDARVREILDAILYYIQKSNLADDLRAGVVITGGGANLVNLSALIKEMSGYNVRMGYTRHVFSGDGYPVVYETKATSVVGMLLAAKTEGLANCTTSPEADDDTADDEHREEPAMSVTEDVMQDGETGTLMNFEKDEEKIRTMEEEKKEHKKKKKTKSRLNSFFNNIKWRGMQLFDEATKDEI